MTERHHHSSASRYERAYGFSRGIRQGEVIEIAGTAPIPQDGGPTPASAYHQMTLCGEIAVEALELLGGRVDDVIRTRMYITDPADANEVGRAHGEVFGVASPVATMVVVKELLDPSWKVEIEVSALLA